MNKYYIFESSHTDGDFFITFNNKIVYDPRFSWSLGMKAPNPKTLRELSIHEVVKYKLLGYLPNE